MKQNKKYQHENVSFTRFDYSFLKQEDVKLKHKCN
jgi:hypothetical protein